MSNLQKAIWLFWKVSKSHMAFYPHVPRDKYFPKKPYGFLESIKKPYGFLPTRSARQVLSKKAIWLFDLFTHAFRAPSTFQKKPYGFFLMLHSTTKSCVAFFPMLHLTKTLYDFSPCYILQRRCMTFSPCPYLERNISFNE